MEVDPGRGLCAYLSNLQDPKDITININYLSHNHKGLAYPLASHQIRLKQLNPEKYDLNSYNHWAIDC